MYLLKVMGFIIFAIKKIMQKFKTATTMKTTLNNVFAAVLQNPVNMHRAQLYSLIMNHHKPLDGPTENPELYDLAENIFVPALQSVYDALGLTGDNPDSQNKIYDAFEQYVLTLTPAY